MYKQYGYVYIFISLIYIIILLGRIDFNLTDALEKKFRKAVYQRKGMKKGNITEALEEAIDYWIKEG